MDLQENEVLVDDEIYIDEEIDDVVQSPNQIVGKDIRRKKDKNYSDEEDIILVKAWLDTSIDAVNATNQKSGRFWSRITTLYSDNIGTNHPTRPESSLNSRWTTLQKAVNKFQGIFAQIETRNASGTTDADKIAEAKVMFKKIHGKFAFEHCWNILRTQPKWMMRNRLSSKKRMYVSCSPSITDSVDLEANNTHDKPLGNVERPLGRKAEKEVLKRRKEKVKDGDVLADWKECKLQIHESKLKMHEEKMKNFSIESENNMKIEKIKIDLENKRLDNDAKIEKDKIDFENKRIELEAKIEKDKVDVENKKIKMEAEKLRHQQVQQELNIVLMDTSTLDEKRQNFIESLRAEILGRKLE